MNVTINGVEVNLAQLEVTLIEKSPEQLDESRLKLIESTKLKVFSSSPITTTFDTDRRYKLSIILYDESAYLV